jgi:hypothetical protein
VYSDLSFKFIQASHLKFETSTRYYSDFEGWIQCEAPIYSAPIP